MAQGRLDTNKVVATLGGIDKTKKKDEAEKPGVLRRRSEGAARSASLSAEGEDVGDGEDVGAA
eukprot:4250444-Pyramimonas_sp.AAC.1